jgi:hypothetical protein
MGFFEQAPPPPPRQEPNYRPPAWSGAPENVLPAGVALNAILARTDRVAVGRKAVVDAPGPRSPRRQRGIVLSQGGGGGSERRWEGRFWLWPLPPEGSLTFAFTWPEEGIGETTVEVDAAPIREAAGRAVELWPDDRPLPPPAGEAGTGGWQSYTGG